MFYTIQLRRYRPPIAVICFLLAACMLVHAARDRTAVEVFAPAADGTTLVIDAGHGGFDGGAIAVNGVKESDINLALAKKLQALAELYGQPVVMTRSDDSRRTDILSYSEREDLIHRTEIVNAVPNAFLISIHQNFYPTTQPSGAQVLYADDEQSVRFGKMLQANLVGALQPENRRLAEPASPRLYLTANANCPAVLVECGFLSNHSDLDKLTNESYQTAFASVLLASFLRFGQGEGAV